MVPIDVAKRHNPVTLNSIASKEELLPSISLQKMYPGGADEDAVHIIVHAQQSLTFTYLEKGHAGLRKCTKLI